MFLMIFEVVSPSAHEHTNTSRQKRNFYYIKQFSSPAHQPLTAHVRENSFVSTFTFMCGLIHVEVSHTLAFNSARKEAREEWDWKINPPDIALRLIYSAVGAITAVREETKGEAEWQRCHFSSPIHADLLSWLTPDSGEKRGGRGSPFLFALISHPFAPYLISQPNSAI